MSYGNDYALDRDYERSSSMAAERAAFIRRTYAHVAGALLALVGLETVLLTVDGLDITVANAIYGSPVSQLLLFLGFIVVSLLAQHWARSQTSRAVQYFGLGVYVVLMAVMLFPLLFIAKYYALRLGGDPTLIPKAGILTLSVFAGLTAVVFITRKDFSFLGSLLVIGSCVVMGMIIAAIIFKGFTLGLFFSVAVVTLMAGFILYDTSNILRHYPTDAHVSAALELFADIGVMFYHILRILLILAVNRD
jgi:FtsH-binding integral membrane protein